MRFYRATKRLSIELKIPGKERERVFPKGVEKNIRENTICGVFGYKTRAGDIRLIV